MRPISLRGMPSRFMSDAPAVIRKSIVDIIAIKPAAPLEFDIVFRPSRDDRGRLYVQSQTDWRTEMNARYGIRIDYFEETHWNAGGFKFTVTKNGNAFHHGRTMYETEVKAIQAAERYISGREKRVAA